MFPLLFPRFYLPGEYCLCMLCLSRVIFGAHSALLLTEPREAHPLTRAHVATEPSAPAEPVLQIDASCLYLLLLQTVIRIFACIYFLKLICDCRINYRSKFSSPMIMGISLIIDIAKLLFVEFISVFTLSYDLRVSVFVLQFTKQCCQTLIFVNLINEK